MSRRDLVIIPDDEPGILARLGEAAGASGINIEACSAFTGAGKGVVHLLVDDHDKAISAFRDAGFDVKAARRVVVADIPDTPGELGKACRKLADAEVNIEQAYIAAGSKLVIVCDDVDRAKEVLGVED
ncbi:MAG: amino acid-binding protein [Actinomycetes bacterium]